MHSGQARGDELSDPFLQSSYFSSAESRALDTSSDIQAVQYVADGLPDAVQWPALGDA